VEGPQGRQYLGLCITAGVDLGVGHPCGDPTRILLAHVQEFVHEISIHEPSTKRVQTCLCRDHALWLLMITALM